MNNINYYKEKIQTNKEEILGHSKIIKNDNEAVVIKKCSTNLEKLFTYLNIRGFNGYPELLESHDNDEIVYRYIKNDNIPVEQKLVDFAKEVGLLHSKTAYYKEINASKYLEIKDEIYNNIKYLKNYYEALFLNTLKIEYQKPIEYLYSRNYSIILSNLNYCETALEDWYDLVKDKTQMRVAIVHNNLLLEHFIDSDHKYLISWDNYIEDSPIFDILNFVKNDYNNINFDVFFDNYFKVFPYNDDEKYLLNILLMLPSYFELDNIINLKNNFKYLYKISNYISTYDEKKINI